MTGPIERAFANAARLREAAQTPETPETPHSSATAVTNATPDANTGDEVLRPDATAPLSNPLRQHHHCNTLSQRYTATTWMIGEFTEHGKRNLISKCVRKYPQYFTGNVKANLQKASDWWAKRATTMALKNEGAISRQFSFTDTRGIQRANRKAIGGRGRRRQEWVRSLYHDLREEFECLRAAGVKFSPRVLIVQAKHMINKAPPDSLYHAGRRNGNRAIIDCITHRWMQSFMASNKIVFRAQTGKLMVCAEKEEHIKKTVAFHLGQLKRAFQSGHFKEEDIENADETHFVINMDNGKTLGFIGDNDVKYLDVVSGGEAITMMVRISGGPNATILPPMLVFKNASRSYPIRGVPDNVPGVTYRSSPKAWMDRKVWAEWFSEPRTFTPRVDGHTRLLFVDNCSSHAVDADLQAMLLRLRTDIHKFPPNATDLVQPADSFVIQKIKEVWKRRWDEYKLQCIHNNVYETSGSRGGSGRIQNPGKLFF